MKCELARDSLLPPGLETDAYELVSAFCSRLSARANEDASKRSLEKKRKSWKEIGTKTQSEQDEITNNKRTRNERDRENISPFEVFTKVYHEREFDRAFNLRTKFTSKNEHLQRLFDAALAILDIVSDCAEAREDSIDEEGMIAISGAFFLLYTFYARQPKTEEKKVKGRNANADTGERVDVREAKVYVSLQRVRQFVRIVKECEKVISDDSSDGISVTYLAASEVLAILDEMISKRAFIVGCSHALTQRERVELLQNSKKENLYNIKEKLREVRDEMTTSDYGGIEGVEALIEQAERYGHALEKLQLITPRSGLDPAKKIGAAVAKHAKRLETRIETIFKEQPKRRKSKAAKKPDVNAATIETVITTTTTKTGGVTTVKTKKKTVIPAKANPKASTTTNNNNNNDHRSTKNVGASKEKKEKRDLQSMPKFDEIDDTNAS